MTTAAVGETMGVPLIAMMSSPSCNRFGRGSPKFGEISRKSTPKRIGIGSDATGVFPSAEICDWKLFDWRYPRILCRTSGVVPQESSGVVEADPLQLRYDCAEAIVGGSTSVHTRAK